MATNKELQEQLDALKAENEALKAQQAEQEPAGGDKQVIHYQSKGKKKIELFKDDFRYNKPLFVGINGRNWVIQRGVEVELPDYVVDFIKEQMAEEKIIIKQLEEEEEAFRKLEDDINRQAAK